MFQYEYEKPTRPNSMLGSTSKPGETYRPAPRPYPVQREMPVICQRIHTNKSTVPLKVWIIASASCFAVCAILVLATVVITKWGTSTEPYSLKQDYSSDLTPSTTEQKVQSKLSKTTEPTNELDDPLPSEEDEKDIQYPILEKLGIFQNILPTKRKDEIHKVDVNIHIKDSLIHKPQIYPEHDDSIKHEEKKIEKKDQAKLPISKIPDFKPTLPDVFMKHPQLNPHDSEAFFEDYFYNDDNLYEDYMQSNSMTSYLIEKVQELHDWITNDSDFAVFNMTDGKSYSNEFGQVLKALNETIVEGNVSIIMTKLKDLYYGENYTVNNNKKIILSNRTDLLSFGILTLDVMLLHNIQMMAWENQDTIRTKMLRDPDVFAFNALFIDPAKVEFQQYELTHKDVVGHTKRQNLRQDLEDGSFGKNIIENVLDLGMSTARATIHLVRAYKNTKTILNQLQSKNSSNTNILQSKNIDGNGHALNHLQNSYIKNEGSKNSTFFTEIDCVWLLYCKNLAATAKLNPPYGVMARINGIALRMLAGELSADRAIDTLLYEALTGWSELKCGDMFPRCNQTNPATIILESIMQPLRKQNKL